MTRGILPFTKAPKSRRFTTEKQDRTSVTLAPKEDATLCSSHAMPISLAVRWLLPSLVALPAAAAARCLDANDLDPPACRLSDLPDQALADVCSRVGLDIEEDVLDELLVGDGDGASGDGQYSHGDYVIGAAFCLRAAKAAAEEVVSEALAPWRGVHEASRRSGIRLGLAATALAAALAVGARRRQRAAQSREMEERRKKQRERLQQEHAARAGRQQEHSKGIVSHTRSGGLRSRAARPKRPQDDYAGANGNVHSRPLSAMSALSFQMADTGENASAAAQEERASKGEKTEQKTSNKNENYRTEEDTSYRQRTADAIAKIKQREEIRKKDLPLGTITSSIVVYVVVRGDAETRQQLYLPEGTAIHSILSNITAATGLPLERMRITYQGCLVKDFGRLETSGRISERVFLLSHGDSIQITA